MSEPIDRLVQWARRSEDALRDAAGTASPDEADALIERASERASQVEQLRALERRPGATAAALPPMPHPPASIAEAEHALAVACREALGGPLAENARTVVARIAATCR